MSEMKMLDAELNFDLPVDESGEVHLSGFFEISANERALVGISKDILQNAPDGFATSDAGFYFFYLFGTGEIQQFDRKVFTGHERKTLPVFIRRFIGYKPMRIGISGLDVKNGIVVVGSCASRDMFEQAGGG